MTNFSRYIFLIIAGISLFFGIQYTSGINQVTSENQNSTEMAAESKAIQPDSGQTNPLSEFNSAIVNIAERTNPTVVTITTRQTVTMQQRSPLSLFFDDPRFNEEREYQRRGLGSGVIVSDEGYIITNYHVIRDADEINVITFDDEEISAEIVGSDEATDMAVLKVDSDHDLSAITLGNSEDLQVGELVLAIGSPLDKGLAHSVSMGIVSAKNRSIGIIAQGQGYESFIQTDAAINPGNSGGALINLNGELIGINTAIASQSGGNMGIGFAIPVDMARSIMEQLISEGRVVRGYLGIQFGAMVDKTMAKALDLDRNYGVVIGSVQNGGPADQAGLQEGDVILKADGKEVRDWRSFRVNIASKSPGEEVTLEIFRDGDIQTVSVELGELPTEGTEISTTRDTREGFEESAGFRVQDLTNNIRQQLNLDRNVSGVVVTEIEQTSPAYNQGLRRGDVITRVGDQNISSSDEFVEVMNRLRSEGEDVALLRINRQGQNMFVAFEIQ